MAIPDYTTDLVDIDLCEAGGKTWAEPLASGWTLGAAPSSNDDDAIQGSLSMSKAFNAQGVGGMMVNNGAGITLPTDGAFLGWFLWACPGSLYSDADGGIRLMVGTDLSNFKSWDVSGSTSYVYGGWINFAVNTTIQEDDLVGTGLGNSQYCGAAVNNFNSIFKGSPFVSDAYRYGRCEARISGGETDNYATFSGYAAVNDALAARWGLIQAIPGGYLWKGLITFGYGAVVDFRDSNAMIILDGNVKKVTANFNKIEIRQATSKVYLTNISFLSLSTASKGSLEMIDNADVQLNSCQFTDMNSFTFLSNAQAISCVWLRCNTIIAPGILLTNSKVLTPTVAADVSAIIWNVNTDLDGKIDGMTFSKGTNAHHAIELGVSSPNSLTIRNVTFSGFNVVNAENDSVLHLLDKGSDTIWTIGCVGCSGTVSYKKARSGDTVNITQGVATTIHVQDVITGGSMEGARVLIKAASGGPKPYQVSVGITRSGTTVTVVHTTHGLTTNDWVVIEGCTEGEYNGVWQITYVDVDSYTYQVATTPSSPATGSPVSTFAPIQGTTNSSGNISDTRIYSSNQPFTGMIRSASGSPAYKSQPVSGVINSSTGVSLTVQMIRDE